MLPEPCRVPGYMLRLYFLLLFGALLRPARAQDTYLPYYSKDTAQVFQLAQAHRNTLKTHLVVPKTGSSEYRDHYKRIVKQTSDEVYNSIRYSALLDPVVNPYVQQVFARILKANPQLPATARLVLTKNPEPNAEALADGTVLLHIGLLPRLENESQLAFILCHELAHVQCRHTEKGLHEQLTTLHSKEMRRQFRRIVNSQYNISSKLKELALGVSLHNSYHSRQHEKQADSLGYVLLARTSFEAPQAFRALELLDKIDEPETTGPLDLTSSFSCASFPKALAAAPTKPVSIFQVKTTKTVLETTDTLKTHPDCLKRMLFVSSLAKGNVARGAQPTGSEYARIRAIGRLEVVQSWFDYDCYDRALFNALGLLREQPQNAYLHSVVQLSLYELRQHLEKHTFMEVVSKISTQNSDSFNQLLYALYGLHFEDFKGLGACFAQLTGPPAAPANEYALAARYAATALADDAAKAAAAKAQYQRQYAGGKFDKLLFPSVPVKTKSFQ
jgi:Zn-dependent protease with chaperone function